MYTASEEWKTMQPPRIEIVPARPAVCRDEASVLDVLVRIIPPVPEVHFLRPPINLGIVLDRSGSMTTERKMEHAREAAIFAVSQLLPTDRVSITIYDEVVETIVASEPVVDKPGLVARIRGIMPRGSTDLFGGWAAGAKQVAEHVNWDGLNRVLLLSDGLANVGVTDPNTIRAEVAAMMATARVSTSALGVGKDYNEDLMEAMAEAGDGNYYYVEAAVQLADIFQTELNGLMATTARDVGLRVETARRDVGIQVMNELERDPSGRLKLPNLVIGMPISILVRFTVPPQKGPSELCRFHLDWDEPGRQSSGRHSQIVSLSMPAVPARQWSAMPIDPAVAEQVALHMAASARKEAITALDRGDEPTARVWLDKLRNVIANSPQTMEMTAEWNNMEATQTWLDLGEARSARKAAHYQQHYRKSGKSSLPIPPKEKK
jgi:Ca-activated chloride channel homolog